jgi:hypothetical protein
MQQQAQQLEQQKLQQQQEQAQAQMQQAIQMKEADVAHQDYQNELDRINKKEIAVIQALGRNENATADLDNSGTADALEMTNLSMEQTKAQRDYEMRMQDIQSKNTLAAQKLQLEKEKLQVARENQANDLAVAKENAKGRNNKKK